MREVWLSLFTPQQGDRLPEMLAPDERARVIRELGVFRTQYSRLEMPDGLIRQFAKPPQSPDECIFARTTVTLSADLTTRITPCQFGGKPDCQ